MKISSLVLALILSSSSIAHAKWYHYAIGGGIGYLAGKSAQGQPQVQSPQQPNWIVPNTHSIISCYSSDGFMCDLSDINGRRYTPAQIARKAGYKYIHKSVSDPSHRAIYIEVSN